MPTSDDKAAFRRLRKKLMLQRVPKDVGTHLLKRLYRQHRSVPGVTKEIVRIIKSLVQAQKDDIPYATVGSVSDKALSVLQLTSIRGRAQHQSSLEADIHRVTDTMTVEQKHALQLSIEGGNQAKGGMSQSQQ